MTNIHHLGFVSNSLESSYYLLPNSVKSPVEIVQDQEQGNSIYIFQGLGGVGWYEVIVPTRTKTTVTNYLTRNGSGLHHLAFQVESIDIALKELFTKQNTVILGGYNIKIKSFGGDIRTKFIVKCGVLIELLEVL
jgi:hypothetical protein